MVIITLEKFIVWFPLVVIGGRRGALRGGAWRGGAERRDAERNRKTNQCVALR